MQSQSLVQLSEGKCRKKAARGVLVPVCNPQFPGQGDLIETSVLWCELFFWWSQCWQTRSFCVFGCEGSPLNSEQRKHCDFGVFPLPLPGCVYLTGSGRWMKSPRHEFFHQSEKIIMLMSFLIRTKGSSSVPYGIWPFLLFWGIWEHLF